MFTKISTFAITVGDTASAGLPGLGLSFPKMFNPAINLRKLWHCFSWVHVCWSEHSDSSFVYGFMSLDYGLGTMTAITFHPLFLQLTVHNISLTPTLFKCSKLRVYTILIENKLTDLYAIQCKFCSFIKCIGCCL